MAPEPASESRLGNGKTQIFLNAFDMYCIGHLSPGQWKNPRDRSLTKTDLSYWINLAKILERGGFLSLFVADSYGGYDTYEGSLDNCIRRGAQWPVLDPVIPISAMAAVTKNLGFAITASTSFEQPFLLARRFSTIDHLTKGRLGWNIVTSWKKAAFKAIGLDEPIEHDERYARADEYLKLLYKLWEGSWQDDAVHPDPANDTIIDPAKVRTVHHHGRFFQVDSKHIVNPSPQRTPLLFQAGTSPAGIDFASSHAEAVFLGGHTPEIVAAKVATIRAAAAAKGRDPRSLRFFITVTTVLAETDEAAWAQFEDAHQYASIIGGLVLISGILGIDLSKITDLDKPLTADDSTEANKVRSHLESVLADTSQGPWTARRLADKVSLGGIRPVLVGSPATVADGLERWVREADIDGFNIAHITSPGTFEDVVDLLVPELRRRGVYPPAPTEAEESADAPPKTLRERVLGRPRLRHDHIGNQARNLANE